MAGGMDPAGVYGDGREKLGGPSGVSSPASRVNATTGPAARRSVGAPGMRAAAAVSPQNAAALPGLRGGRPGRAELGAASITTSPPLQEFRAAIVRVESGWRVVLTV